MTCSGLVSNKRSSLWSQLFLTSSHKLRHISQSLCNSLAGKDMQSIDSEDTFSKKGTVRFASTGQPLPGMHCPAGAGFRVFQQDLAGPKQGFSSRRAF